MHQSRPARPLQPLTPIAAALLSLSALPALAQSSAPATASASTGQSTVPTVTVTAPAVRTPQPTSPKATTEVLNTPQTLTVIPAELLSEQGARSLTEALRNTPGISFSAGENGFATNNNNFSLRGFDTSGSVFIDGMRDSGNYSRDAYNLEQVEVVKGPAADNGRGGAGGYINLVSKTPKADNFIHSTLSYGFDRYDSDDRVRATLDLNRTLGAANSGNALRLNLLVQDGGVAGRQHAEASTVGFAPSVALGLGPNTRLTLAYQFLRQDDRPDWGVPAAVAPGTHNYNAATDGAGRDRFYGHHSDYDDVTSNSLLARVEHRFSPQLSLSNQTRWARTERDALYTVPTGFVAATGLVTTQRQGYQRSNTSLGNLTNLALSAQTGSLRHQIATGLELTREESKAGRFPTNGTIGNPGSTSLTDPNPDRPLTGFTGFTPTQTGDVSIDTVALYANDTVELSPQWQITGGLRLERYEVDLASRLANGAPQGIGDYSRSETSLGGKLGIVYKPAPEGSIYASVGRATLPPGSYLSNPDISREGENAFPGWTGQSAADSKEQVSTNVEVGVKWEFAERRLATSAALFRTVRSNVAWTGRDTAAGGASDPVVIQGYGKQVVQGLELGVSGKVTPAWTLNGGVVVLRSERQHDAFLDQQRKNANPADYGSNTSTDGDELAFTPRVTGNLWTTYRLGNITLGGGLQHVGRSWAGRPDTADRVIPNGMAGRLPAYTVYNLMAAYEVTRNLALRLNIDNVTDKRYLSSGNWNMTRAFYGAPRNVVLSANLVF